MLFIKKNYHIEYSKGLHRFTNFNLSCPYIQKNFMLLLDSNLKIFLDLKSRQLKQRLFSKQKIVIKLPLISHTDLKMQSAANNSGFLQRRRFGTLSSKHSTEGVERVDIHAQKITLQQTTITLLPLEVEEAVVAHMVYGAADKKNNGKSCEGPVLLTSSKTVNHRTGTYDFTWSDFNVPGVFITVLLPGIFLTSMGLGLCAGGDLFADREVLKTLCSTVVDLFSRDDNQVQWLISRFYEFWFNVSLPTAGPQNLPMFQTYVPFDFIAGGARSGFIFSLSPCSYTLGTSLTTVQAELIYQLNNVSSTAHFAGSMTDIFMRITCSNLEYVELLHRANGETQAVSHYFKLLADTQALVDSQALSLDMKYTVCLGVIILVLGTTVVLYSV